MVQTETLSSVDVTSVRTSPAVWSLQNPDNPLDPVHGNALLETTQTCQSEKHKQKDIMTQSALAPQVMENRKHMQSEAPPPPLSL